MHSAVTIGLERGDGVADTPFIRGVDCYHYLLQNYCLLSNSQLHDIFINVPHDEISH